MYGTPDQQEELNLTIGRLDYCLSKLLAYAAEVQDGVNVQTLKHHAEDMIGAGNKILEIFKQKGWV